MITIYILILIALLIFVVAKWMDSNTYHDPPDGTVYKYDEEDSEFSATHLKKKK